MRGDEGAEANGSGDASPGGRPAVRGDGDPPALLPIDRVAELMARRIANEPECEMLEVNPSRSRSPLNRPPPDEAMDSWGEMVSIAARAWVWASGGKL